MERKWIKGFEGLYEACDTGDVVSYKRNVPIILSNCTNSDGYVHYDLWDAANIKHVVKGHRVIAETFILNTNNLPEVNHKDGVKHHNWVSNLEWITHANNTLHAYANNLCPKDKGPRVDNKRVRQLDKQGQEIAIFNSLTEAAKTVTLNTSSGVSKILQVCTKYTYNGYTRKTAFGYTWEYVD